MPNVKRTNSAPEITTEATGGNFEILIARPKFVGGTVSEVLVQKVIPQGSATTEQYISAGHLEIRKQTALGQNLYSVVLDPTNDTQLFMRFAHNKPSTALPTPIPTPAISRAPSPPLAVPAPEQILAEKIIDVQAAPKESEVLTSPLLSAQDPQASIFPSVGNIATAAPITDVFTPITEEDGDENTVTPESVKSSLVAIAGPSITPVAPSIPQVLESVRKELGSITSMHSEEADYVNVKKISIARPQTANLRGLRIRELVDQLQTRENWLPHTKLVIPAHRHKLGESTMVLKKVNESRQFYPITESVDAPAAPKSNYYHRLSGKPIAWKAEYPSLHAQPKASSLPPSEAPSLAPSATLLPQQ